MQFDFFFVPALPLAAHTAGACSPDFTPRLAPHLRTRTRLSYETENITRDARLTRLHLIKILNPIPLSVNQNLFPPHRGRSEAIYGGKSPDTEVYPLLTIPHKIIFGDICGDPGFGTPLSPHELIRRRV